jgi:hypothetical protein
MGMITCAHVTRVQDQVFRSRKHLQTDKQISNAAVQRSIASRYYVDLSKWVFPFRTMTLTLLRFHQTYQHIGWRRHQSFPTLGLQPCLLSLQYEHRKIRKWSENMSHISRHYFRNTLSDFLEQAPQLELGYTWTTGICTTTGIRVMMNNPCPAPEN